ncbi:hypothetical protein GCM10009530_19870 [Microbispora corallina]|uniref:Uncharacterized protein n=1 Tax=Microbispora corallina TaxID=83302 RepID=A0ABQ4FU46_9ACTN|nr:hypothetical protein [Microbispora corallina]GIH38353.1 hypothetical protein Mco01_13530 [Microbispora corallina]
MASIVQRIKEYFQSQKGREGVERVKTMARDPRNRERVHRLMDQWRGRRAGTRHRDV